MTAVLSLAGGTALVSFGVQAAYSDREPIVTELGLWSIRLILLSYAMSPLADALRRPCLRQCRRTFGLWGFAFALAHAVFYIWSVGLWPDYLHILIARPYLLCGTIAFLLFAALAATSPLKVVQRIGPRARKQVHRALYVALPFLLLHETLYLQDSWSEIIAHMACFALFSLARLRRAINARRRNTVMTGTTRVSV